MRSYTSVVVLALPSLALAASLSDFKPYLDGLPTACNAVYKAQIPGCQNSDFTSGKGCSDSCITGLDGMVPAVQLACSGAGISGNNVLSAFLAGNGVYQLCPNSPSLSVSTSSAAPSTTATPTTTSQTPTTTSQTPTTTSTTAAAATTSTSQATSTTTGSTTSSSSLSSVATSATSMTSNQSTATSATGSPTTTGGASSTTSSQGAGRTGGNNSGGGSPFDSTGAASGISISMQQILSALLIGVVALA